MRIIAMILAAILMSGCAAEMKNTDSIQSESTQPETTDKTDSEPEETEKTEKTLTLTIDQTGLNVEWEDNETVNELLELASEGTITVRTSAYGGFEQVGSLPQSLARNDVQMTTEPGDIVLYSGNQLVVFFGSNSWSYTKLGHIDLSVDELSALLGNDTAVIEIAVK